VPKSVLEAIKMGQWDFEPQEMESRAFASTDAMPGTKEKVEALAERLRCGCPLWHPNDRHEADDPRY